GTADGSLTLWDVQGGKPTQTVRRSWGGPVSLAWAPTGKELAIGSDDGLVRVWDLHPGSQPLELGRAGMSVRSVTWSPAAAELAALFGDGSIGLFERLSAALRGTLHALDFLGLATVPGGWFSQHLSILELAARRLQLLVPVQPTDPPLSWRVLPLGGLARYLE